MDAFVESPELLLMPPPEAELVLESAHQPM
jgi:hypothetical protein